jgi:hypothetical protein
MQFNFFVKCPSCSNKKQIAEEEVKDFISECLAMVKRLPTASKEKEMILRNFHFPKAYCEDCDCNFLIDENLLFERIEDVKEG